ncbi:Protein kinase [Sorangium cellulosum So ce56]|uniref:Protein kinase n=1 Tax=Sorangium cellulosum (strain So ce56) TaxID=448385 RepID=A9FNY0_SORC5|nr:serine/threonine-protein kinase [Sorangium cellulosum]CAN92004.1 Protein kinase [Sorangium cellulosum So ce56]
MTRPGDVIDGRFEIERYVGAGGMGQVFFARDGQSGEPVAVKVLLGSDLADSARFEHEARALAALQVPGIVRYVAHGATGAGRPYLAMQWLAGETLAQRLERGPLAVSETVVLLARAAATLGAIHRLGVVHRDIKPSNLLLMDGAIERVTLLDFGIARISGLRGELTQPGAILGTPGYMAPEQARAEERIDARADVFALGCVAFECITGRPAFLANDPLSLLMKVVLEDPPPLRELCASVPAWLEELVAGMLAKEPDRRPADAEAVADWMRGAEAGALVSSAARSWPPPADQRMTTGERRLLCLVLADDAPASSGPEGERAGRHGALREIAEEHGGRLDRLQERWLLASFSGAAAPTDLAARAGHCALAMAKVIGDAPMAVVLGRSDVGASLHTGELIERAVRRLSSSRERGAAGEILIDEVVAPFLEPRFQLSEAAAGRVLRGVKRSDRPAAGLPGGSTEFVGRDRELSTLVAELRRCVEERAPAAVLVTGAPGMGKSRLRRELLRRARSAEAPPAIWVGLADPMSAGSAFALLSGALRSGFGIVEGEPLARRCEKVLARVSRHAGLDAPRVAAFLGEIVGAPFPDEDDVQLRAARRNPMLMADQLRAALEAYLRAECAVQPVVLVLEDLHWGDLPTVTLIEAALHRLGGQPLLVLALARPEVHDLFPRLWEGHLRQEIRLTPLARRASERLVRQALGSEASDALVARLVERAEGNAFFLEELIRAAMSDAEAALPETVLVMVQSRIEALHPSARQLLRAASIFGQAFRRRGVEALVGAAAVAVRLDDLEQRELLVRGGSEQRAEGAEYRFRHALVQEAAYQMLTEQDRRTGHALAGDWLERTGDADPMVLAGHFERGAEPLRAAAACLRAAQQSLRGHDLEAAIERAERGIACAPSKETVGALRLVQAEAHVWRGELALAEERGTEAARLVAPGSAPWYMALYHAAMAYQKQSALGPVMQLSATARDAAIGAEALGARTMCLSACAGTMVFHGEYAPADALLEAVERAFDGVHALDQDALAVYHQVRAFQSASAADPERSLRSFGDVLAAFEQVGDRRNACATRANLAHFHYEIGDFAGAEALLRAALAAAEEMELHELEATIQSNLGLVLARVGKLTEAHEVERAALEATRRMNIPRFIGSTLTYLAEIAILSGDFEEAERHARDAVEVLAVAPPLRAAAVALLARALLELGRPDEALERAREAQAALDSLGGVEEGEALIRLTYAEALAAAGHRDEAEKAIAAAAEALMARASKFQDPRWRDSFLERVPEHAQTRSLARQWLGRD